MSENRRDGTGDFSIGVDSVQAFRTLLEELTENHRHAGANEADNDPTNAVTAPPLGRGVPSAPQQVPDWHSGHNRRWVHQRAGLLTAHDNAVRDL